jgi:uncharacterized membrane protein HdeD (DUF308 family)
MQKRSILAVLAGMLFMLAGVVELATSFVAHKPLGGGLATVGAMFLCVGAMWLAIAARWKQEDAKKL